VAALHNAPFNKPGHLVDPLEVSLRKREALLFSDLHYVGSLFNPHLIHDMELRDDQQAMAGFMRIFQLTLTRSSKPSKLNSIWNFTLFNCTIEIMYRVLRW
jgi:hypothetical protein